MTDTLKPKGPISKRELHEAMQAEMVAAANKLVMLKEQERAIIKEIDYWTRQEEAARVVSIRLDIEAGREGSSDD